MPRDQHWQVYLPAVLGSFVVMGGSLFQLEKRGYLRAVFLASIALMVLVQLALWLLLDQSPGLLTLGGLLFVFFYAFNVLEASQPSMVSRQAPASARGAAMGVYNTLQSLGFFVGGMGGGWLIKHGGAHSLFGVCAGLMTLWLGLAWSMPSTAGKGHETALKAG